MKIARLLPAVLLVAGLGWAQDKDKKEEMTAYDLQEIEDLLMTFKQTYNKKSQPEEDAVSTLENLKNAYLYLASKGTDATKEDLKAKKNIVNMIAKRGLFARKRPLVTVECARTLGYLEDPQANNDLRKWLERVLDEKSPNPQWVEYGFQSLAWIGTKDKRSLDLALDYATKGKHPDIGVASQAIKACYEWKHLDAKVRKVFFNKISQYLGGLYSKSKGGEAKQRGEYERRYNAVKDEGLRALMELSFDNTKFRGPTATLQAQKWWNENKKSKKWVDYTGPKFRKKPAKKDGGKAAG